MARLNVPARESGKTRNRIAIYLRLWRAAPIARGLAILVVLGLIQAKAQSPLSQPSEPREMKPAVALEAAPDEKIRQRLQRILGNLDGLAGFEAEVDDGVVTLRGIAKQSSAKERAGEVAERLEGVVFVDNQIERETRLSWRLEQALETLRRYGLRLVRLLPVLVLALGLFGLAVLVARWVYRWEAPWRLLGLAPLVRMLVQRLLFALVILGGLFLTLDLLDVAAVAVTTLGAAGLIGIALGFAFRDIVENYLAGILLSLRHPFGLGDLIRIGEQEGKVVRLNSRELVLITLEGNHVRIPNSTVFKSVLTNYTHNAKRRFQFDVGIATEERISEALRVAHDGLNNTPGVIREPAPYVLVEALGDSSVIFRCFGWMNQDETEFLKVRSAAIQFVKRALDRASIEMPEPIHQVRLRRPAARKEGGKEPPAAEDDAATDIAPTRELDEQIDSDLRSSYEPNALAEE